MYTQYSQIPNKAVLIYIFVVRQQYEEDKPSGMIMAFKTTCFQDSSKLIL